MNKARILALRNLIARVRDTTTSENRNFCMRSWQGNQGTGHSTLAHTVEELHACGNTACIAGYMALMPEFQAIGGRVCEESGSPVMPADPVKHAHFLEMEESMTDPTLIRGLNAVAAFLEIPYGTAQAICTSRVGRRWLNLLKKDPDFADLLDEDAPTSKIHQLACLVAEGWEKPGDQIPKTFTGVTINTFKLWSEWTPAHAVRVLDHMLNHAN